MSGLDAGPVTPVRLGAGLRHRGGTPGGNAVQSENNAPENTPQPSLRQALIHLDEFSIGKFIKELFYCYKWSLAHYPVYTKSITSATIAVIGELIASAVKQKLMAKEGGDRPTVSTVSLKRVGVFGLYGLLCTGPMLHYWYTWLEHILTVRMGLTGDRKIAAKLVIDRCLWGPPFVLFTISFLQLLQTLSPQATADAIKRSYLAVLIMNQKVWVPGQFVNFKFVPVEFQVLFVNAVNVGWNTYLSLAQ